jgi:hypothetical protein
VGSKEGWKPQEGVREQSLDDFMDDQDHQDWGGPTNVKQDYGASAKTSTSTKQVENDHQPLAQLFQVKHQTVGPRLLRRLGWREGGSTAYVTRSKGDDDDPQDASQEERTRVLSAKKLRKIQLLATRIPLPPPKLDQCGLGFEPHQDAPEFRRHKERRKQLAQERARGPSNVYRASQLTNDGSAPESAAHNTEDDPYVSYETMEDFVGRKSVGGFALREDDDDAYDDAAPSGKDFKVQVSREGYNMEVYENSSDDDQQHMPATISNPKKNDAAAGFEGVLASWAKTTSTAAEDESKHHGGLTTDGRPPLAGFVLGGSVQSHIQRYPGPDVPLSYQAKRHVFGENQHPLIFQTLSRSVKLEAEDQRRQVAFQEALQANKQRSKETRSGPMAGGRFAGLQLAMKSRFTTASTTNNETATPIGLHVPDPTAKLQAAPDEKTREDQPKKEISITRTIQMFSPHPLVCKRFHVPVPKHASKTPVDEGRQTESTYFTKEILAGVSDARAAPTSLEKAAVAKAQLENEPVAGPGVSRPPIEALKSIFEPETESSEDEEEAVTERKEPQQADIFQQNAAEAARDAIVVRAAEPDDAPNPDSQLALFKPDESKEKISRSDRRRRRKRRSRSSSPDSSNEESRSKSRRKRRSRSESPDASSDDSRSKHKKKERHRDRKRHEKKSRKSKSSKRKRH